MRRELRDFGVDCVARQPAKRRRARYEDRREAVTYEELHGNAKWFRAWSESTYSQYYALEDCERWGTVTSTNGTWSATLSCASFREKDTHASAFISSIA